MKNTLKRIFCCTRGYHEIATVPRPTPADTGVGLQCVTVGEGMDARTFFRCGHCEGRFVAPGGPIAVRLSKATPAEDNASQPYAWPNWTEELKTRLAQESWWPNPSTLGAHRSNGGFHGPVRDPLLPIPLPPPGCRSSVRPAGGIGQADTVDALLEQARIRSGLPPKAPQVTLSDATEDLRQMLKDSAAAWEAGMPRRQLKDQLFVHVAETMAQLGTCCRLKVGCLLLTKEGRTAATGYNGSGPGMPHCDPATCNESCRCSRTAHSEQNALANCAGTPYSAWLTHEPCVACAKALILAGVRKVVFKAPYTSIAPEERAARQEWIDFYRVSWKQLDAIDYTKLDPEPRP